MPCPCHLSPRLCHEAWQAFRPVPPGCPEQILCSLHWVCPHCAPASPPRRWPLTCVLCPLKPQVDEQELELARASERHGAGARVLRHLGSTDFRTETSERALTCDGFSTWSSRPGSDGAAQRDAYKSSKPCFCKSKSGPPDNHVETAAVAGSPWPHGEGPSPCSWELFPRLLLRD